MATLLIGYDLNRPGQDYPALFQTIESLGPAWHCLDSTWLVVTFFPVTDVINKIAAVIDAGDKVLALDVSRTWWVSRGLSKECTDWLYTHVPAPNA